MRWDPNFAGSLGGLLGMILEIVKIKAEEGFPLFVLLFPLGGVMGKL